MKRMHTHARQAREGSRQQQGLSLIEVMISVFILGVGLLGLAGLQTRAVVMNQSAYYRSIATDLATDLADRIRANRTPFLASADADTPAPQPPDFSRCSQVSASPDTLSCSAQEEGRESYLVSEEMAQWHSLLRSQLPDATFTLTAAAGQSPGFFRYTLTISWTDNRSAQDASAKLSSYVTVIE
ncbi:type IV pilus modification protein PilV [Chitinilyticum litopenaei]|uniref:type IV pilus modification protein PilV n=1 Tax=Chitinilyticum litopenaei TaxID=1121276 RepID=UPI000684525D|nr:type IV pilus modification protein PilV [Chitinilyticum litopenaei]